MPDRKPAARGERKDGKGVASSEEQVDVATELASIKTMLEGIATDIGWSEWEFGFSADHGSTAWRKNN